MVKKHYTTRKNKILNGGEPVTIFLIHHGISFLLHSTFMLLQHAKIYHVLSSNSVLIKNYDYLTKFGDKIEDITDTVLKLTDDVLKFIELVREIPGKKNIKEKIEESWSQISGENLVKKTEEEIQQALTTAGFKLINQITGINVNFFMTLIQQSAEIKEMFEPPSEIEIKLEDTKFIGFARLNLIDKGFLQKLIKVIKEGLEELKKTYKLPEEFKSWTYNILPLPADEKEKAVAFTNFYTKMILGILSDYNKNANAYRNNVPQLLNEIKEKIKKMKDKAEVNNEILTKTTRKEGGKKRQKTKRRKNQSRKIRRNKN